MKTILALIASAALSTSTPTEVSKKDEPVEIIVPNDNDPITDEEIEQKFYICLTYLNGEIGGNDIVSVYNLDTPRKRRDFELVCQMVGVSFEAGYTTANDEFKKRVNEFKY